MIFDFVPLHTVVVEIEPNVARHHKEIAHPTDYGVPNIDWDTYIQASIDGNCWAVTARDNGKLVGYSVYVIGRNPRYKHILEASGNGIFLEKEYRREFGKAFTLKADEYLQKAGVHEVNYTLTKNDRFGSLLSRNGFSADHEIWSKKYGQ